jgi:hypothetical protein
MVLSIGMALRLEFPESRNKEEQAMGWRERLAWVAVCLELIPLGLTIFGAWPVLAAHLTTNNWIVLALMHLVVLFGLGSLLIDLRKNAQSRVLALVVTMTVIMSWAYSFRLMEKIGH